jgi:predicted metal-binding membrane protein
VGRKDIASSWALPYWNDAKPGFDKLPVELATATRWDCTPWKWAALRRCHGVRVPRRKGDRQARLRMGAVHGTWCVVSCGPAMVAMVAMVVIGHPLALMVGLTLGLTTERVAMRPARAIRLVAATTTLLALATAGAGALGV